MIRFIDLKPAKNGFASIFVVIMTAYVFFLIFGVISSKFSQLKNNFFNIQ